MGDKDLFENTFGGLLDDTSDDEFPEEDDADVDNALDFEDLDDEFF